MDQIYSYGEYHLRRKFFQVFGKVFRITAPDGTLLFHCRQKAFKLKEDIRLYADEQQQHELLNIKARQILDFSAAYDIVDSATMGKIGALKRKGWSSLVRDKWIIMDSQDNEIGTIEEDSTALALVRRFSSLRLLLPQNFRITVNQNTVAELKQHFNPFIYKLNLHINDPSFDRRLGIAAQVLIAAIEDRQD